MTSWKEFALCFSDGGASYSITFPSFVIYSLFYSITISFKIAIGFLLRFIFLVNHNIRQIFHIYIKSSFKIMFIAEFFNLKNNFRL